MFVLLNNIIIDDKKSTFEKGKDEVLINILNVEYPENLASVYVTFIPIAGDYTKFVKDVIIIGSEYKALINYSLWDKINEYNDQQHVKTRLNNNGQIKESQRRRNSSR